jgi:gas vesicle protein
MACCSLGTKTTCFLAGLGVGAIVAILLAPKSGKETRKSIADKAEEGKAYMAAKGRELGKQAEEFVQKGKEVVARQKERLAEAVETGKETARTAFAR